MRSPLTPTLSPEGRESFRPPLPSGERAGVRGLACTEYVGRRSGPLASSAPGVPIPGEDAIQQRNDVVGEEAEERLTLLGGRHARVAEVARLAPFPGDPAPGGGLERAGPLDRLERREVADQMRCQPEHHRGLPLAGVADVD